MHLCILTNTMMLSLKYQGQLIMCYGVEKPIELCCPSASVSFTKHILKIFKGFLKIKMTLSCVKFVNCDGEEVLSDLFTFFNSQRFPQIINVVDALKLFYSCR